MARSCKWYHSPYTCSYAAAELQLKPRAPHHLIVVFVLFFTATLYDVSPLLFQFVLFLHRKEPFQEATTMTMLCQNHFGSNDKEELLPKATMTMLCFIFCQAFSPMLHYPIITFIASGSNDDDNSMPPLLTFECFIFLFIF